MVDALLQYIDILKEHGNDDKHQRSHIVNFLITSIIPMQVVGHKFKFLEGILSVGDKLLTLH